MYNEMIIVDYFIYFYRSYLIEKYTYVDGSQDYNDSTHIEMEEMMDIDSDDEDELVRLIKFLVLV